MVKFHLFKIEIFLHRSEIVKKLEGKFEEIEEIDVEANAGKNGINFLFSQKNLDFNNFSQNYQLIIYIHTSITILHTYILASETCRDLPS